MIEKLNRLKTRLVKIKAPPSYAIFAKSSGLDAVLEMVEGLVDDLVHEVIDQGNRLTQLESVVDDLVVEQGTGVGDGT